MLQSNQESTLARSSFSPIVRQLDDELVRLEIWAGEIGVDEPNFGRSLDVKNLDLVLTRYMTSILERLSSKLAEIEICLEVMRRLISKISGSRLPDVYELFNVLS